MAHTQTRLRRLVPFAVAALIAACGGGGESSPPAADATSTAERTTGTVTQAEGAKKAAAGVSVRALLPVGVRRIGWASYDFDYRVVLQNNGPALDGVTVRLVEPERGVQVLDGTVSAGSLAADSVSVPEDTITIRKGLLPLFILRAHEWLITFGPPTITGTAAVGAALANANVSVTDTTGANVCAEPVVVTTGTGAYTCTVLAGRTAPFLVAVTDPAAAYPPLVSIVTTTPAAGTTLVANATPLTTAIVGQLAPDGNALSVLANPALIDLAALAAIQANVLAQIQPVLAALGAPAGYDPFTTQIVPASPTQGGNTADQVIETLRITTVAGVTRIGTVDNPAGSVPIANATTTTPPVLPPPSPALLTLDDEARAIVRSLNECFALPVATRVLAVDTSIPANDGGRMVTSMAPACQAVAHPDYLTSGFRFGQRFYGALNDPAMVGAQFMGAEIMFFFDDTTPADNDSAVLNLRFKTTGGIVGNRIEVVRKLPGSATAAHPSEWWMHGNRRVVDLSISSFVYRREQLAPNPGTPPFANAGASRFETGFSVFVNKDGPNSLNLRAARVFGPGLPTAGLVLTRPDPAIVTDQNWLNLRRKDGLTDPASATPAADTGTLFIVQRTQGLTAIERPNPNAGNTNSAQFVTFAHPLDYGMPINTPTTGYINFAALGAWNVYTFELFYDGEVTPRHTQTTRIVTGVLPAPAVANLRWHALTPATLDFLTPGTPLAAATSSVALAWVADPFAELAGEAGVFTFGGGASVIDGRVPVTPGSTSGTATAPAGSVFPALTGDGTSSRLIELRYRMLDGSQKFSGARFN